MVRPESIGGDGFLLETRKDRYGTPSDSEGMLALTLESMKVPSGIRSLPSRFVTSDAEKSQSQLNWETELKAQRGDADSYRAYFSSRNSRIRVRSFSSLMRVNSLVPNRLIVSGLSKGILS